MYNLYTSHTWKFDLHQDTTKKMRVRACKLSTQAGIVSSRPMRIHEEVGPSEKFEDQSNQDSTKQY